MIEQIENATGVDIEKLAKRREEQDGANLPKELA
jgi:hypothetical protein